MGAGRNSHIGWGEEGSWGTAQAASKYAELVSESMKAIRTRTPRPVVYGLDIREGHLYDEKFGGAGSFTIEANYEGLLKLIEHALGVTWTPSLEQTTRYSHDATLTAEELMVGEGLTFEVHKDLGADDAIQLEGAKIRSLVLSANPTRNLQLTFDVVAEDASTITATSPTMPDKDLYVAGHHATVEVDDVAVEVDEWELTIDNGLDDDKRILGVKTIAEPVRSDTRRLISGSFTADAAVAQFDDFLAGTLFKLELLHTGAVLDGGNYAFNMTMATCIVDEDPIQVTGPGLVKMTVPFRVLKPTAGLATMLVLRIENEESTIA